MEQEISTESADNPREIVRALTRAAAIIEAIGNQQTVAAGEIKPDLEQQYHYISDAELEALTATFTELASSAGRVAASLTRINALSEETHADLNATRQALEPMRLSAKEEMRL